MQGRRVFIAPWVFNITGKWSISVEKDTRYNARHAGHIRYGI